MYTYSGRGRSVGRGDNRPLGFYGVGSLAGGTCYSDGIDADGLSCKPDVNAPNPPVYTGPTATDQYGVPTVPVSSTDVLSSLIGGAVTGATGTPTGVVASVIPAPTPTNYTNWIILGAAALGLLVMLGGRR